MSEDCNCINYHDSNVEYRPHKYHIGAIVEYRKKLGSVLYLSHYMDGKCCYTLVNVGDDELTCTAPEDECILQEAEE